MINREVFSGASDSVAFVAIAQADGSLAMRWNSISVNQVNFGDRAAPEQARQEIRDLLSHITGLNVSG